MNGDTSPRCEACDAPLSFRSRMVTGVCYGCRRAGAAFAVRWMRDLRDAGRPYEAIAKIVGISGNSVRARLSELARGLL